MATAGIDALKKKIEALGKKEKFSDARDLLDKEIRLAPDDGKKEIEKLYSEKILKGNQLRSLKIDYDSFGEGLEPIYYWTLDAMRNPKLIDYKVSKASDYFAASEASFFYGDIGARRTALEKRASELIGTINMVIKSVINLLWDLKEFELRLQHYEDFKAGSEKKTTADMALKAIFLTEVDTKKGRAAINMLAQDLNFITLRDAFMAARKPEDVDGMDLNERVKRVLKPRVAEYLKWVELSGKELKSRFSIEKTYLKSQVSALELYTRWAKPYLVATNKLMPKESPTEPEDLISAFDVSKIFIELLGKKEAKLTMTQAPGSPTIELPDEEKVFQCVEVIFHYRTVPGAVERGHFIHKGRVRIDFSAHVMQAKHLKLLEQKKEDELLKFVSGMTGDTLAAMRDDLNKYLEEKPKEEEKKKEFKVPGVEAAREVAKAVRDAAKPFKEAMEGIKKLIPAGPGFKEWDLKRVKKSAEENAKKDVFKLYDTYKKMHGMYTW